MLERRSQRVGILVGSTLLLLAVAATQVLRLDISLDRAKASDAVAETSYMPPNEVLRFVGLGHEGFLADLVMLQANQYFLGRLFRHQGYDWLPVYTDALVGYCRDDATGPRRDLSPSRCRAAGADWVSGLFPWNPALYLWAARIVKLVPRPTRHDIDRAIVYAETGVDFCPDSWEVHYELGFNQYFELQDLTQAEKEARSRAGLENIKIASRLPGSRVNPNFVVMFSWSSMNLVRSLRAVYQTYFGGSPMERAEIRERLSQLGQKDLAAALADLESRWESEFPYLTLTFYHQLFLPEVAPRKEGSHG